MPQIRQGAGSCFAGKMQQQKPHGEQFARKTQKRTKIDVYENCFLSGRGGAGRCYCLDIRVKGRYNFLWYQYSLRILLSFSPEAAGVRNLCLQREALLHAGHQRLCGKEVRNGQT